MLSPICFCTDSRRVVERAKCNAVIARRCYLEWFRAHAERLYFTALIGRSIDRSDRSCICHHHGPPSPPRGSGVTDGRTDRDGAIAVV